MKIIIKYEILDSQEMSYKGIFALSAFFKRYLKILLLADDASEISLPCSSNILMPAWLLNLALYSLFVVHISIPPISLSDQSSLQYKHKNAIKTSKNPKDKVELRTKLKL